MDKPYDPEALARRIFTLILLGIATEIAAMVYLGFYA
jgi:hypothetical protein